MSNGVTAEASGTIWLYTLEHKSLPASGLRFQKFQQAPYDFGKFSYPYRDWDAPATIDSSAQGGNRPHEFRIRRSSYRDDASLPIADIMRYYSGFTGAVLRCLRFNTLRKSIDVQYYHVRASMLSGADVVFMLQCTASDARWPTVPAVSPTYQRIF